jgi:TonB family protein
MLQTRHHWWVGGIVLLFTSFMAGQQALTIRVPDSDQEKKLIKRVEPVYPESAQSVPLRGPVILEVVANEMGEVVEAKIVKGGNPVVQKPVLEAVKQWRYSPTYMDGKAVPVKFGVTVPILLKK